MSMQIVGRQTGKLPLTVCNGGVKGFGSTGNLAWTPLYAPGINEVQDGALRYPASQFYDYQDLIQTEHPIIYARKFQFKMSTDTDNSHSFRWHVDSTRKIDPDQDPRTGDLMGAELKDNIRTTRIRVAWPNYGDSPSYTDDDPLHPKEVAYSEIGPYWVGSSGIFEGETLWASQVREKAKGMLLEDPRLAGHLLTQDYLSGDTFLCALGSDSLRVEATWKLISDGDLLDPEASITIAAGRLDTALLGEDEGKKDGVIVYSKGSTPDKNDELAIGVKKDNESEMELKTTEDLYGSSGPAMFSVAEATTAQVLGTEAPAVYGAKLTFSGPMQQVILLGRDNPDSARIKAWRFSLALGRFEGPFDLNLPEGLTGFSVDYEPFSGRIFLFGGEIGSQASDLVYVIDEARLSARVFPTLPHDEGLARAGCGTYLDPKEGILYVYGGTRGDTQLDDGWKLDLATRTWSRILVEISGPGAVVDPLVFHNSSRQTLWVGSVMGSPLSAGLEVWALGRQSIWTKTVALKGQSGDEWPVQGVMVPGAAQQYQWMTDSSAAWPGQLLVASLESDNASLGITVRSMSGEVLSRSEPVENATSPRQAAFICPKGQVCLVGVEQLFSGTSAEGSAFTVTMQEGQATEENHAHIFGPIADLLLRDKVLYAAAASGLYAFRADGSLNPVSAKGGFSMAGLTGISTCGSYLCVSRTGIYGLKVVDVSEPQVPQVKGSSFTFGMAMDVAATSSHAYVANGFFGIGVYSLTDPTSPSWKNQVWTMGMVVSIARRNGLLAAGLWGGKIKLYDIKSDPASPKSLGSVMAKGKISRVAFHAGLLWVLGKNESWVEIFDVSKPAAPVKLGEIGIDAKRHFNTVFKGTRAYSFENHKVKAYVVQPGS